MESSPSLQSRELSYTYIRGPFLPFKSQSLNILSYLNPAHLSFTMQLSIAFVFSSLLTLAVASPVERSVDTVRIPITKRGDFTAEDGTVDPQALRAHLTRRLM